MANDAVAPQSTDISTPLVQTAKELRSLQVLRAVAAILVVIAHARDQFPAVQHLMPSSFGHGGVDIFFIISGFVMTYTASQRRHTRVEFLRRRVHRLTPLYWTMTAFTAALLLAAPRLMRDSKFTLPDFITSLLFFPQWNAGKPDSISPMLKLGWTLNYEMFFYVLFAVVLTLAPLRRTAVLAAMFAALMGLRWLAGPTHNAPLIFWADPMVFEFLFGCALGALDTKGLFERIPRWAALASLVGGVVLLVAMADLPWSRVLCRGLPAIPVVLGALALERDGGFAFRLPAGLFLGDASYSIYLGHLFPVIGFRVLWEKLHLPIATDLHAAVFVVLCIAVGTGAGALLHVAVERPLGRMTRWLI